MDSKSWMVSRVNWASWLLALLGGLVAGIQMAQEKGLSLPWWVLAVTPVLTASILPFLRSMTTEKVTHGGAAPVLVGLAIALMGFYGGAEVSVSGSTSTAVNSMMQEPTIDGRDVTEDAADLDVFDIAPPGATLNRS